MSERRRLDVVGGGETGSNAGSDESDPRGAAWSPSEVDATAEEAISADALLYNAAGVRFETGRVIEYDAGDQVYERGARVVCEAAPTPDAARAPSVQAGSGVLRGVIVVASRRTLVKGLLRRILRAESSEDRTIEARSRAREQSVYVAARDLASELGLPIKIVYAEEVGTGGFTVYFASEERVAFRDLAVSLSHRTNERIELRQIGLRDASKVIGGVGPCGLQLCCNTFLSEFAPVTIKMAKDQGLGVNPQKLTGLCGRLLCCLVYEEAYYRAQRRLVPRIGDRVVTDRGEGAVRDVDVLQMLVKVTLPSGEVVTRPVAELKRS
jgi:cell fate regulator YaaT (PSP1 superfamily)